MNKGRIIFLNGVTSSGKTSIVDALQEREDVFFYVVANDLFEQMVGDGYLPFQSGLPPCRRMGQCGEPLRHQGRRTG